MESVETGKQEKTKQQFGSVSADHEKETDENFRPCNLYVIYTTRSMHARSLNKSYSKNAK